MIAPQIVADVRRLLTEELLSQRKIARLTGVSRSTIAAIASGKRPDYELLRQLRENDWEEPTGPAVRCPGCGNRVYMPCQLCRILKRIAEKRRATGLASATRRPVAETFEPLGLNLRPEHHARYEEVRAWRMSNEPPASSDPMPSSRSLPLAC
jgi:transcriptional regulator with XRE-family HTH domain